METELVATRPIASLCLHVESALDMNYHTLDFIPSTQFSIADQLFVVYTILADIQPNLIL